jgi:hypothetical protein
MAVARVVAAVGTRPGRGPLQPPARPMHTGQPVGEPPGAVPIVHKPAIEAQVCGARCMHKKGGSVAYHSAQGTSHTHHAELLG